MIVNRTGALLALAFVVAMPIVPGIVPGTVAGVAWAQQSQPENGQDPDSLIEMGKRLRAAGDDQAAYDYYLRAYGLARTARAAGQLALCEFELNRWVESETHLQEALRAGNDPWVRKNRAVLMEMMAKLKMRLGRIEVTGRPEGAEVEIAGRSVGRLPLPGPVRVPAAPEVFVRVAASGYKTLRRTVEVQAEELARVVVDLEPGQSEPPTPPLAMGGPAVDPSRIGREGGSASNGALASEVGYGDRPPPGSWQRKAGWIGMVAAGAMGAGGAVGLLLRYQKTGEFNDYLNRATNQRCNAALPMKGGGPCAGLLRSADQARTLALVSFAGAGLVGVISAILLATAPAPSVEMALDGPVLGWRF
jgi:hypothetical protein